jgi:hypothetical protein
LSFDDLFTLFIIIVFVGLPLLNRLMGKGQPPARPAPGQPAQRPGGPRPPTARGPTDERDDDGLDDLSRRLEEARRRVREAMGEPAAEERRDRPLVSGSPAGRTVASAGVPSGTVGGNPAPAPARSAPTPAPQRRAGTPVGAPPRLEPRRPARAEPLTRSGLDPRVRSGVRPPGFASITPTMEVDRDPSRRPETDGERATRERAHRDGPHLLGLDETSIRKGLLWHMILGEPAAFAKGRMRSPRPSR